MEQKGFDRARFHYFTGEVAEGGGHTDVVKKRGT